MMITMFSIIKWLQWLENETIIYWLLATDNSNDWLGKLNLFIRVNRK